MAASILQVLINGDASGLTKALDQATKSAKSFGTEAEGASQAAGSKLTSTFAAVGQTLKTLAPAFIAVGAAAVAGIFKGVQATTQWASDTRTLQRITGQTAESASGLLGAANLLGVSVSSLSTGFGTLSKNIINGSANLDKYGIATTNARGDTLPFDDVLGNIVDKFATLQPGAEQTAFAMNVFGRSGKDLLPILQKGRDGIAELTDKAAELGLVMSQDDVDAAKRLSAAQRELGLALKGAGISLGQLFIPALTKVVNEGTKALEFFTRLPDPVKETGVGIALAAGAVGTLTLAFSGLKATFGPVIEGITGIGKALLESGLLQDAGAALSAAATGVEALGQASSKAGQQLQLDFGGTSEALQVVNDAATGASAAVQAAAVKSSGALEGLGSKLISGLSGIGSAIADLATGPVGIIAAIAAAVAILTVVVIKNWDTIKKWASSITQLVAPFVNELRNAVTALGPPLADLGRSLGDLGTAIGEALGPLLPILEPIAAMLAKIFAGVALAPFLFALKTVTVGFQVLAKVIQFVAGVVEGTANIIIKAVNAIVGQINNVIGFSNKWLGTNFGLIQTVDELGTSSTTTAGQVDDLATATDKAAKSSENASKMTNGLRSAIQGASPLLEAMGTNYRTLAAAAQTAFDQATASGADTTAALQTFAEQQIEAAKQARSAFEDQARSALTFTTSMLSQLEQTAQQARDTLAGDTSDLSNDQLAALQNQAHITATDILDTFKSAAAQSKSFGQDLLELSKIGGKAGKDLAQSLLQSGDVLAAQVVADAPSKIQKQIVTAFGKSENAADSFSTKLTNAIVGPLHTIQDLLVQLAKKAFGVNLTYNDHGANSKVNTLHQNLENITGTDWNVFVGVHTGARSPWPDEALKMHLTDPLARMGFKKVNGTWTLPLQVGIHSKMEGDAGIGSEFKTHKSMMPNWYDYATSNVPNLPEGHTHISTNPHNTGKRALKVRLDRRAFSDELAYEVDYGRGF